MSAAAPADAAGTRNGDVHAVPLGRAARDMGPLRAAQGFGDRMEDDDDEAMTDDMRIAISALGLMREGSLSGKSPTPTSPSTLLPGARPGHVLADSAGHASAPDDVAEAAAAQGRARAASQRSDPSRSASTASMASYSDAAWTGAATSETGVSSPAGSMHISNDAASTTAAANGHHVHIRDAEMGDGTARRGPDADHPAADDPHFIARVSQLPIVSGGIEWYERSKANSRVVKVRAPRRSRWNRLAWTGC